MTEPVRALVIDDDFRVGGLHRDIVASRPGFEALTPVRTAAEARSAVRAHKPDLLIVDLYLPDGDGVQLVREHDVDAFIVTAATDSALLARALRSGAFTVLIKPFARRLLEERLDAYLRYRNLLTGAADLDQVRLDRAVRLLHADDGGDVARRATEQLVLEHLADTEASASEIAERIGVSRATAQRHLSALAARGRVEVRLRYGATGRPEHRYARVTTRET